MTIRSLLFASLLAVSWIIPVQADLLEFEATIDSDQAIGCIGESSPGFGTASLVLDTDTGQVDYTIEYSDLSSNEIAAHIHGPAGPDCAFAGIIIILPGGNPKVGFYILQPDEVADMLEGLHFVLIHSSMWPQGELRGQVLPVETESPFVRGDADADGALNALVDSIFLLSWGFSQGAAPTCMDSADVDDNGIVNALVDGVNLLSFGFAMGPPPPPPHPDCGDDPAPDALSCVFYSACP